MFGHVLKTARQAHGLGRGQLLARARKAAPNVPGLQIAALKRWEEGRGTPYADQLAAVAAALEWSDEELAAAARLPMRQAA